MTDSYRYSAYGVPLSSAGSSYNNHKYGGKYGYYDHGVAGTILAGRRWYNPYLMRWLTHDPIGYEGGSNLYEYVGGNPVGYIDPSGLSPFLSDPRKKPPGYSKDWIELKDSKGRDIILNPNNGRRYRPHHEDNGHWPHYDWFDPETGESGKYPEKCSKPWPRQRKEPYSRQSQTDPWNDLLQKEASPSWIPSFRLPGAGPLPIFIDICKGDYMNCQRYGM